MDNFFGTHAVLTFLIAFPLIGAVFAYLSGERNARWVALATGLVELALSLPLLMGRYAPGGEGLGACRMSGVMEQQQGAMPVLGQLPAAMTEGFTHCADFAWLPWGIHYRIGMDGISLFMVLLTTLLLPLMVLGSWTYIRDRQATYYSMLLALTAGVVGVFVALDMFVFYVFWEVMLIPMYFLIGIWGGKERIYAAVKFFLYTAAGSLLMLVAILWMFWQLRSLSGMESFSYFDFVRVPLTGRQMSLLFLAFAVAFAIKVPVFPFHTWLPHAHVQAPTAGSVILAGVLLKMGTYGFIRFALPLFPDAARDSDTVLMAMVLGLVGIIYAAMVAAVQPNAKKLVAYTSVAHLGFVILGIFAFNLEGLQGALLVMIGHGLSTPMLFFLLGMLYERRHTYEIADLGGLAASVPVFSAMLVFAAMASIGLPGTSGFVSEFLVLLGTFRSHPWAALVAGTGVIFAAYYMLPMVQKALFNTAPSPANRDIPDLNLREVAILAPLVVLIIWLGVAPQAVMDRMEPSAQRILQGVHQSRLLPPQGVPEAPGPVAVAPNS
jgi:NADH-quinone oxidoreductase subunit M